MIDDLPGVGTQLGGRFTLEATLGEGAMGAVFAATDATTGAAVAVKVLRRSLGAEARVRRRFRREAAVLEALEHPGVVRVLLHGVAADGLAWIALERLVGETLAARIGREGPLAPTDLVPVVEAVAGALAAAHARGVLHGDVKPENVFLVEPGAAKLVDFGLAKVEGLERLTRTGEIGGTPAYLPPEAITGEAPLDARADVYGLGVTLFEALAGRPAFAGRHPGKVLFAVASGDHAALAALRPGLPEALIHVVEKAMAPHPVDRIGDVAGLARRFSEAVASGQQGS